MHSIPMKRDTLSIINGSYCSNFFISFVKKGIRLKKKILFYLQLA
jgi:hypothetical protein